MALLAIQSICFLPLRLRQIGATRGQHSQAILASACTCARTSPPSYALAFIYCFIPNPDSDSDLLRIAKTEERIYQANTVISNFEYLRRVHHVRDNLQKVLTQVEFFSR